MSDKPSVDINLILDASGSMAPLRAETVSGINGFIADQRKLDAPAFVTLTTFDYTANERYHAKALDAVPTLSEDGYFGGHGGGTALLDAVSDAIAKYESLPIKADKAMFVIVTDGQENASTHTNLATLRETIKRLQDAGIAFIFLGANDSIWQAAHMGVAASGTYKATSAGTASMYHNLSHNTMHTRMAPSSVTASATSATQVWTTGEDDGA